MSELESLTEREVEVLRLIANGLSNQEIAEKLVISLGTVKWYNSQIYGKLAVSNRAQAVVRARDIGVFEVTAKPTSAPSNTPNNLPATFNPFIGRKQELADIHGLMGAVRLVTITGSGGIGKTRLALEFARSQLANFKHGVYFVSLVSVENADNLIWAIAETLGFQFRRGNEPLQQLLDYFHQKSILLILDNFEHLLEGASLLPKILKATERLRMIVTSRERLNLYSEVTYTVGGLRLAEKTNQTNDQQSNAAELFSQRAAELVSTLQFSTKDKQDIERICELVGGMPLAIELAATWVDTLRLAEIANEIEKSLDILQAERRDALHSYNSMRAAFMRSWNLLNATQKMAFRRLAVYRGGFDRQTVSAVAEVNIQTLRELVSKSLLRYDSVLGRYDLHELLRYFAQEKLNESGELEQIYERHAAYFADFIDAHWQQTKGHQQHEALQKMEADIENVRAAWQYWIGANNVVQLNRFFHGLWVLYDVRGWYPALLHLFEQATHIMQSEDTIEAQSGLGWLLAMQGTLIVITETVWRKGYDLTQKGVQILRRLGQPEKMIMPLMSLFVTAYRVGEDTVLVQAANECLEIATSLEDKWSVVKAKQLLALYAIKVEQFQDAERLGNEALAICENLGDRWSQSALCIEVMSSIAIRREEYQRACQWLNQGLQIAIATDLTNAIQLAYFQLGYVAALQDNFQEAGKYWHQALRIADYAIGDKLSPSWFSIIKSANDPFTSN